MAIDRKHLTQTHVRYIFWAGVFLAGPALFYAFVIPEKIKSVTCPDNLRQIGLALHMYSGDHGEQFPDDLTALQPYLNTISPFICPKDAEKGLKPFPWELVNEQSSYFYVASLKESAGLDRVHMFKLPEELNGDGGNILFSGGYVQWCPVAGPTNDSFWGLLAQNGITPEIVASATNRIIHISNLQFPTEGEYNDREPDTED